MQSLQSEDLRFGRGEAHGGPRHHAGDTKSAQDAELRAVPLGVFRDDNPKTGQRGGVVVKVSFYHAGKFAMEGWTESVAKEVLPAWNKRAGPQHVGRAEPSALAATIFNIVGRGSHIPIRVPLGADAWGLISNELEETKKDMEELKKVSLGA
ncbi:Uu.00g141490.m01.CDS01 [Anthostomella pinea]|uniref:Uu.00g141490.m01.CDS01 n=1 Tax=Anthostomella pinea TaxID=933095 RepID=A0AAI8YLC8_9PEZI|nr:Uu.00g141490.m01.CDS01 [Anthostomella pinea]